MVLDYWYLVLRPTRDGCDEERKAKKKGDMEHGCWQYHLHGVLEASKVFKVWCLGHASKACAVEMIAGDVR